MLLMTLILNRLIFYYPVYFFFHVSVKLSNACFIARMCVFLRMKQLARACEAPWDTRAGGTLAAMGTKCRGACQAFSGI